ncbi:hypothetical protein DSLASN_03190 [Desulfoluna limicola]|uniref:HTH tetR-type domain-containing protein n=1 Tax=Desulfoluna limicola TaxID=2810562 RepID=A0ABM7PAX0_9BACT|nr:TetR family transcriptional regulator [Desulfoluna limicola]BCS94687.1 hypothetical protein DSLASN_03190 [Desulfoluna limicola]
MNDTAQTGMKLPQLSKKSGLSISTLYEYLRSGVLHPPVRRGPTKATYNESHLKRLKTIRAMREKEKLPLAEIKKRLDSKADAPAAELVPEEDADIRNQIIDTALTLFSRKHYDKTKISDITNALHMGNGTFYRYFKSKEELFLHCLERLPKIMVSRDTWNEVKREPDYITRLRKRGDAMLGAFHSYIGMLNHTKLVLGGEDRLLAQKAAECLKSLSTPLRKDLELAIAEGQVRPMDTDLAAFLLLGINETFGHRLLMDATYTTEEGFDIIEDFLRYALTPHNLPSRQETPFTLTLLSGESVTLKALACNGSPHLTGAIGAGTLQIAFNTISTLSFSHTKGATKALLVTDANKKGELSVDPDLEITGTTELGMYAIKVADTLRIERI